MIFEQRRYSGEEYNGLLVALLQSPNVEDEIQYFNRWASQFNPKFYLLMFREIDKMRESALESSEMSQVSAIEDLNDKLHELEERLQEDSNVIMAELPDSILGDKKLVEDYLGEFYRKSINEQMWRDFQSLIDDKINSIPRDKELPFLKWCEAMLKMNLVKHNKDCTSKGSCPINSGYDRRIQYIARLIEDATPTQTEPYSIQFNIPTQVSTLDSGLKLSSRKGSKIDLIRIVNAMWELGFFRDSNGQIPTKLTVMKAVGTLFGIDLSDYDKDLSQAFQTHNPEPNIKIFRDLEEVTKNKVLD